MAPPNVTSFAANLPAIDQLGRKARNREFGPYIYTARFVCIFLSADGSFLTAPAFFNSDKIAR
jgi:hypothetical protein